MFKYLTINLTQPICSCLEENLAWGISYNTFIISCLKCKIEIRIPCNEILANFYLEQGYPGKIKNSSKEGNNVIPFPKK